MSCLCLSLSLLSLTWGSQLPCCGDTQAVILEMRWPYRVIPNEEKGWAFTYILSHLSHGLIIPCRLGPGKGKGYTLRHGSFLKLRAISGVGISSEILNFNTSASRGNEGFYFLIHLLMHSNALTYSSI